MIDVTIVTCKKYLHDIEGDVYINNIFQEYQLLKNALERKGLSVHRTYWDDPDYDWSTTKLAVVRTVWDYFERYNEFTTWMESTASVTQLINKLPLQQWNSHKFYLQALQQKQVRIIPTEFVPARSELSLETIASKWGWKELVIKPAISAAAYNTYKITEAKRNAMEQIFRELLTSKDMMVQEFQETIVTKGEASLMVFNGKYTHAVLKKAKAGDFRVQDDFGGTVHPYVPSEKEIEFAEFTTAQCPTMPVYGRVDIIWDKEGVCYLSEIELLDPEIWIRKAPETANILANAIATTIT